jgi:hypothetical protein
MDFKKSAYEKARILCGDTLDRPGSYDDLLRLFGNIVVQVDQDDYQGDSYVCLEKDGRYGFLTYGWGSCSGCDALYGCNNFEDLESLIISFESDIKWFDTFNALLDYVCDDEARQGSYYFHNKPLWSKFRDQVIAKAQYLQLVKRSLWTGQRG